MSGRFLKETGKLKSQLVYLSAQVEENLSLAIESVMERDAEKAALVVERDRKVDLLEVELEEECLKILALYQPVATDLRFVIALLKMNNDLERIGDHTGNIAKNARFLSQGDPVPIPFDFHKMASHAQIMLRHSLKALLNADTQLAHTVREMDDFLDWINRGMYAIIERGIRSTPQNLEHYIHMSSISRALERIGDLAVNMAEDVIYLYEGRIVRHTGKR